MNFQPDLEKIHIQIAFSWKRQKRGEYELTDEFSRMLRNPEFYKILKELIEFGVSRYEGKLQSQISGY